MSQGKTDSTHTIEKLREVFARLGISKMIFSVNSTHFTSEEFKQFCEINLIIHQTSVP